MLEVDYDTFVAAWATYWGRRELGIVIDNESADRIARRKPSLRLFYDQWREAVRTYPADASLRLMGTPALTAGIVDPDIAVPGRRPHGAGAPRPAAFGAYLAGTPSGLPQSELSGRYSIPVDPDSEGARAGRTLRRGTWATPLAVVALLTCWWAPLPSVVAAVWALALAIPVSRLFFATGVPLRLHWRTLAVQVLACVAIVLAVAAAVPQLSPSRTSSKGVSAMSESLDSPTVARVLGRLRAHWPVAEVDVTMSPSSPDRLESVRVEVSAHISLEAMHLGRTWAVHPLTDASGSLVPIEPDRPYTIGIDVSAPPEEFADRFYEEVYFWWTKLQPGTHPTPPQLQS